MRFRKRVKIFPGFSLNFSNSGVSSSVGFKGASITLNKRGTYLNTSIPGTGLSERHKISGGISEKVNKPSVIIDNEIRSEVKNLTSANLVELREVLHEAFTEKNDLIREIEKIKKEIKTSTIIHIISNIFLFGLFFKSFKIKVFELKEYLINIENQLLNCFVDIDIHFDKSYEDRYKRLVNSYQELLTSKFIWDVTSSIMIDPSLKSAAANEITRIPVKFKFENIGVIKSSYPAFHFENKNGGDIYIYPAFIIMVDKLKNFYLIDIKEFDLIFSPSKFLEEENIPLDTKIIDKTWKKVNKNGSPDKRFKDNYEIPIVKYGKFSLKSKTGLNESYMFSNFEKSEEFVKAFLEYQKEI